MEKLNQYGIQPTPQRIAVARFVLNTDTHPTAEEVWIKVRTNCPTLSRATVYNTLNLFVEKGLLKPLPLQEGTVAFDPHIERHHHFIDERSGKVFDLPWDAVKVTGEDALAGFEVREYQVVLRGRRRA